MVTIASYLLAAGCMLAGTAAEEARTAAVLLALACGWDSFLLGATWSTCSDIAGRHAGVVGGVMNTAGQIGGMLSPIVIGVVLERSGTFAMPLYLTGALFLIGALCWCFIDPDRAIGK